MSQGIEELALLSHPSFLHILSTSCASSRPLMPIIIGNVENRGSLIGVPLALRGVLLDNFPFFPKNFRGSARLKKALFVPESLPVSIISEFPR